MRAKKAVLGGLIVVMLLGLAGCGGSDSDDNVLGGKATADLVINDDKAPFYDHSTLKMPLDREITFTVFNDAKKMHNIVIPAFDIDMDIPPGQTVSVKIPAVKEAPRDGFFSFYCKYHQAEGEQGRIDILR